MSIQDNSFDFYNGFCMELSMNVNNYPQRNGYDGINGPKDQWEYRKAINSIEICLEEIKSKEKIFEFDYEVKPLQVKR